MQHSRTLAATTIAVIIFGWVALLSPNGLSQSTLSGEAANPFREFFDRLATAQGVGAGRGEAAYMKLVESLGTMAPGEIAAGIPIIDGQLDDSAEPEDRLAKADAANLLMFISWRPDGPELLASQMDRLKSMLTDPSHTFSGPAALALQHIGIRQPEAVWPILESALKAPETNNATGIGPSIAIILLRMGPHGDDVTEHVAQYMRRPDLTDSQLISTIIGIDSSPVIPDLLTAELIRCLDRPNEHVKSRALVGIARSSPSAKDAARARVQRMTNDPRETAHIRRLAAEALEGQITEDPDTDK
jgi:hypothetical protein